MSEALICGLYVSIHYNDEIEHLKLKVEGVAFPEDEQKFLRNAVRRAITIEHDKIKVILEGKVQQRALDAVEEFMGIGKFAKIEPEEDPAKRPHDDNGCSLSCGNPKKMELIR